MCLFVAGGFGFTLTGGSILRRGRFQLNTPNADHDPNNHADAVTPQEAETDAATEEGGGSGYGVLRMLVAAPGLIVAKFTYDLIPFLPQWAEYILLTVGSWVLGNILISGYVALAKRADEEAKSRRENIPG